MLQQCCCLDASHCAACLQAIVKLPFANVKRLAAAAQQADPNEQELTPADEVSLLVCPTRVFAWAAMPFAADACMQTLMLWKLAATNLCL
jgi:hypothetical protein